ncbi:MAG: polynucleotide adenylyltransferase PcnB [Waddliaceae bacterium]|jgi:poly(A) polymerase|nr:polynucleotide adenylyltransferase PcnB [Waddliaceae bacterium]
MEFFTSVKPTFYKSGEHHIDSSRIDSDALYVLNVLHNAGHTAYLVGGGVRDLLSGIKPKDFDISTSATPQEIKDIFRRKCLLIGRRFRLAHIRFGASKFIEVATFRSGSHLGTDKLIVRDNEWGTEEEDVLRRDFTINGLFYDPHDDTLIDYVGGCEDITKKVLRSIGDPVIRFKQDPVRMIRLLKFQSRFGYAIDAEASEALECCRDEITKSSQARLLEEFYKMLESGSSASFFRLMFDAGFLDILLPAIAKNIRSDASGSLFSYLEAADALVTQSQGPCPDRAILASCIFFPLVNTAISSSSDVSTLSFGDIMEITRDVIGNVSATSFFNFPRRLLHMASFIIHTQYRFTPISDVHFRYSRLLRHEEFHLALVFLKLRTLIDGDIIKAYSLWQRRWDNTDKSHIPVKKTSTQRPRRRRRPR